MKTKNIISKLTKNSFRQILSKIRKRRPAFQIRDISSSLKSVHDLLLSFQTYQLQNSYLNPLNKFGKKCFSQSDCDGITIEILRRLNIINKGTFIEYGVGDGLENNTLILKALGWKGLWIGSNDLAFKITQTCDTFIFVRRWITLENILDLTRKGINTLGAKEIDLISIDLDGNDIYFVEKLLTNKVLPKVFIVEYNAKFLPPIKWQITYDPDHSWQGDDYFGASLSSFVELFEKFGFTLVCCNAETGANAFFVKNEFLELFKDVPKNINDLHVSPRYHLLNSFGHKQSIKSIERLFS